MATDIDELQISITANTEKAVKAYKALAKALKDLKDMSKSDFGFNNLSYQVNEFSKHSGAAINNVKKLADALDRIKGSAKYLANIKQVEQITKNASKASEGIQKVPETGEVPCPPREDSGLSKTPKQAETAAQAINKLDNEVKKTNFSLGRFGKNLLNIAKYRAVRSAISSVAKAFKEGSDNLYAFISASNSAEAKSMKKSLDGISSSFLQLKNTLGVTFLSTMSGLQPIITTAVANLVKLGEGINAIIALLKGEDYYLKATEDSIKRWSNAMNNIQGFDELNVLNGTGESDPFAMFEEAPIDEGLKALKDEMKTLAPYALLLYGVKRMVNQLTGGFDKKNTALEKQTEKTKADSKATAVLGSALGFTAIGAMGAYGWLKKLNDPKGALDPEPAGAMADTVEELGSQVAALNGTPFANLETAINTFSEKAGINLEKVEVSVGGISTAFNNAEETARAKGKLTSEHIALVADNFAEFSTAVSENKDKFGSWKKNVEEYALQAENSIGSMAESAVTSLIPLTQSLKDAAQAYKDLAGAKNEYENPVVAPQVKAKPKLATNDYQMEAFSGGYSGVTIPNAKTESQLSPLSNFSLSGMFNYYKDAIGDLSANWFNKKIEQEETLKNILPDALKKVGESIFRIITGYMVGGGAPVFGFANGGFVDAGQVFVAREAGPEMVGRIGNKTAVANNDQITTAIANAVYGAMMDANANKETKVNVVLEGNTKNMFRVLRDEARSYGQRTGNIV